MSSSPTRSESLQRDYNLASPSVSIIPTPRSAGTRHSDPPINPEEMHKLEPPAVPRFRTRFDTNCGATPLPIIDEDNALFDIEAPDTAQPPDALAYLYLVGSDDPTPEMPDKDAAMRRGRSKLLASRHNNKGLFVDRIDAAALAHYPSYPYMHGLDLAALEDAQDAIAHPEKNYLVDTVAPTALAVNACGMLLGNVRVPFPACLDIGPDHPRWLELIAATYAYGHPADLGANHWRHGPLSDAGIRRFVRQTMTEFFADDVFPGNEPDWEEFEDEDYE